LKLDTGSAFVQGLGIILAPVIVRLFAPEAFGPICLHYRDHWGCGMSAI